MKNILVPMDFTDVGVNALRYALNAFPDSTISVLHIKVGSIETNEPLPITLAKPQIKYWTVAFKRFIKKELKIDRIPDRVTINVMYGPIIDEIKNYSEKIDFDAIIMGTRDKYNFFDQWFGTVSVGTVKTTNLPVYLIPKYATYSGFENVMVASDDHLTDPDLIQKINAWNKQYGAFVKFLHIQRQEEQAFKEESTAIVSQLFEKHDPEFSFEIAVLQDTDISHSLLASAYDMKADLLMVLPEDQNFIQSVLFKSISKDLILQSDIPLLFIKK